MAINKTVEGTFEVDFAISTKSATSRRLTSIKLRRPLIKS
jgi:hypothetical protein